MISLITTIQQLKIENDLIVILMYRNREKTIFSDDSAVLCRQKSIFIKCEGDYQVDKIECDVKTSLS